MKIQISSPLARLHSPQINCEGIILYSKGHDDIAMDNGFDVNIMIHILADICQWIRNIQIIIGNKNAYILSYSLIVITNSYFNTQYMINIIYRHVWLSLFPSIEI